MKKNKKLFAILTLVAFMMTLMPVMAFAADLKIVSGAVTADDTIVLTANGVLNSTTTADGANFTVSKDGSNLTVDSIAVSGANITLTLNTSTKITTAGTVTIAYDGNESEFIANSAGDVLVADSTVTAKVSAPAFVSATATVATPGTIAVVFDQTVAGTLSTVADFTVKVNNVAKTVATATPSGDTVTLTLSSGDAIAYGDKVTVAYTNAANELANAIGILAPAFSAQNVTVPNAPAVTTATSGSKIYTVEKEADIDSSEKLEYDIQLLDGQGNLATNLPAASSLVVWVERTNKVISDVDALTSADSAADVAQDGYLIYNTGNAAITDGKLTVKVASGMTGKVTVKAAISNGVAITTGTIATFVDSQKGIFGEATGEFTASQKSVKTIDVEVGLDDGAKTAYTATVTGAVANGLNTYNVVATVKDSAGKAVDGQKVTMSANKSGVTLSKAEATTDSRGQIKFDVTAEKSATGKNAYMITLSTSSVDKDIYLAFSATDAVNAKLVKAPEGKVAVDSEVTLKVAAFDINGNRVTAGDNPFDNNSRTYAKLGDKEYNLTWDATTDSDGNWVAKFTPAKVGTYDVTMALKNGKKVVQSVEVAEQGKIVSMELKYDAATINLNATTPAPEVTLIDAEGVSKTTKSGVTFAINGKGIKSFSSTSGVITTESDDKYAGEKLTVTAVDRAKGVTSVAELTIAADAQSLAFGKANGVVGQDLNIAFNVVDANGNVVALGTNTTIDKITTTVTSKPEGATASATVNKENDLKKTGVAYLQVASNKEGTIKVQVMIEATTGNDTKYYTGAVEAIFGKDAASVNSSATLIIGSTTFIANGKVATSDVAPFVQNGRTFLPVRALAEALGATVEFDAATNVVTIKCDGVTAAMTLGSAVMTVNDEVVTMDTAAFATTEGRTVIPVRYAAQALGYEVTTTTNADGTTATVTLNK